MAKTDPIDTELDIRALTRKVRKHIKTLDPTLSFMLILYDDKKARMVGNAKGDRKPEEDVENFVTVLLTILKQIEDCKPLDHIDVN